MPGKTSTLYKAYKKQLLLIGRTRKRCEDLCSAKSLDRVDIQLIYGGLFLEIFTGFESLIEDLFMGLIAGKLYSPVMKKRVKISPKESVRDIVFNGKSYLDWFPYEKRTKPLVKRFFDGNNLFCALDPQQEEKMQFYYTIRNALAHKSEKAKQDFLSKLPGSLLQPERTPAGYLRSQPSASSSQTQLEIALIELDMIAKRLCGVDVEATGQKMVKP